MGERKQLELPSGLKSLQPPTRSGESLIRLTQEPKQPSHESAPDHFAAPEHRPAPQSAPPPPAPKSVATPAVPYELVAVRESTRTSIESTRPALPTGSQTITIVEQVVARLAATSPHGVVSIALDPPELGRVLIKFQRRGRELNVRVEAEHPEAIRQLRHELPQLEAVLSRLREPVVVEVFGQSESRDAGFLPQREPSASQAGPDRSPQGRPEREATPHHGRRRPRPRSPESQLDVWS